MPVNILRNTLKKFFGPSDLLEDLSGSAMGAASGLLMKKIFIGKSGNAIKKLIGSLLQMSISSIVAQNADLIKSTGQVILKRLFQKNA